MLRFLKRWFDYWIPSDEMLMGHAAPTPENHEAIVRRMNELEALRAIARRRVEELHTTTSPLRRKA